MRSARTANASTWVGARTRIINRMKSTLIRLGIRDFNPKLPGPIPGIHWRLDEVLLHINGVLHYLSSGVDQNRVVANARVEVGLEAVKRGVL
jgi:transposase-like protein